jgi:protoheme IX farnesyltransferase
LKKVSSLCTVVGAAAGALPPVMGWTAATGGLGAGALALFLILFFWQFPHFFALAWIYRDDYARAGLSMLPVLETDGRRTAFSILAHSAALLSVSAAPTLLGLTGPVYLSAALVLGLSVAVPGVFFFVHRDVLWARRLFFASVIYLPLLLVFMILNRTPVFLS